MSDNNNNAKTMYEAVPAAAELNKVPGFDPLKFLRRAGDSMKLDLPYQKLWFRMAHPNGRMRLTAMRITEQMAIFEAKVFLDRSDAEPFSVSDYVALAGKVIEDIHARGKNVLLVGGTGLYARSLLKAVPFTENSRDDEIRGNLEAEFAADGIEPLYARLKALDPEGAEGIHPNNTRRVIRALEYCMVTGEPFSKQAKDSKAVESPYDGKMLVLSFRDRETLYGRINLRVEQMFADGLLKEAEDYFKRYGTPGQTSVQAIGYKELFPYFEGQCSLDEAKENIKRETRRYAKRQLTWFRREEDAVWLFADDFDAPADLISAAEDIARAHFED